MNEITLLFFCIPLSIVAFFIGGHQGFKAGLRIGRMMGLDDAKDVMREMVEDMKAKNAPSS